MTKPTVWSAPPARSTTVYVPPDLDREIEQRAADADVSTSQYAMEVLETHIQDDLTRRVSQEAAVERRIEEVVAHATREVENSVAEFRTESEALAGLVVETAKYARATWALVKSDYGDTKRRQAIGTGIQAAEREAERLGVDVDALGTRSDQESTPGPTYTPDDDDDQWYF